MSTTKMTRLALAIAALTVASGAMAADSGSGTIAVSASIAPECAVGNTTALEFGNLMMMNARGEKTTAHTTSIGGTFDVICTNGTNTPKLRFTSPNADGTNFRLLGADGSTYIVYSLAQSVGSVAVTPGNDAAFTGLVADGTTKSLQVVGLIAAQQKDSKRVQNYSDTITVTSSYTP